MLPNGIFLQIVTEAWKYCYKTFTLTPLLSYISWNRTLNCAILRRAWVQVELAGVISHSKCCVNQVWPPHCSPGRVLKRDSGVTATFTSSPGLPGVLKREIYLHSGPFHRWSSQWELFTVLHMGLWGNYVPFILWSSAIVFGHTHTHTRTTHTHTHTAFCEWNQR